jgi:hypothetical protein
MNEHQEQLETTFKWTDLVPSDWFKKPAESSVWMAGYRIFKVPPELLASGPKIIDLAKVRAILVFGKMTYQDSSQVEIEFISENQWRVNAGSFGQRETPEGAYLLLMSPFDTDGVTGHEASTRQTIALYVGLLATLFGRNIVYRRLFDNIVQCGKEQVSSFNRAVENPLWFPAPIIDDTHLAELTAADARIASLADQDKQRIQLSLRWFESAVFDNGVDAFLKCWIALETLGMPDTTNIRPLNETLAGAYGISVDEARDRFGIGKLFGLRSRIVHDGVFVTIGGEFQKYTEAIFIDVLRHELELTCAKKAEEILTNPTFDLNIHAAA